MEEQLFKMEESAAFELGNSNCCLWGLGYGAYAREGRRSSSWWWNHRLRTQPCWCPLLDLLWLCSAPGGHLQHPHPMWSMSQSCGQATTGNGHVCEIPPAHPGLLAELLRSNQSFKGCWGKKKKKEKKKTQPPPKNEIGLHILKGMRK